MKTYIIFLFLMFMSTDFSYQLKADAGYLYSSLGDCPSEIDSFITKRHVFDYSVNNVTGAIVSHHLFVGNYIAGLFHSVYESRAGRETKRVVIVGPDHFRKSVYPVSVSMLDWKTDSGIKSADSEIVSLMVQSGLIFIDNSVFFKEHSISSIVPFVARYFPEAKIVPVILGPNCSYSRAEKLGNLLADILDDESVLIISSDFSHYKMPEETDMADIKSIKIIESLHSSYDTLKFNEIDCDNRKGLCVLFTYFLDKKYKMDFLGKQDSARIAKMNIETTSYLFYLFGE